MNYTPGQSHALMHARRVLCEMGDTDIDAAHEQDWRVSLASALYAVTAVFEDDCDPPLYVVQAAKDLHPGWVTT